MLCQSQRYQRGTPAQRAIAVAISSFEEDPTSSFLPRILAHWAGHRPLSLQRDHWGELTLGNARFTNRSKR